MTRFGYTVFAKSRAIAAACLKLQHWFINFYTVALLIIMKTSVSSGSCCYSTRHSHPDCQSVPASSPFPPLNQQVSQTLWSQFYLDAPKIWNDPPGQCTKCNIYCLLQEKCPNLYLFAKAYTP